MKPCFGQVLNGGADVFRCIAAEWKSVDSESVNDSLRQQAKQVQPGGKGRTTWTRMHSHMYYMYLIFADLLWYHLWDGSQIFGGANGGGGE